MFCFKCLEYKKKSEAKNYIQSLNAKLSMLRINLKSKIKKKSYKYRSSFKTTISNGDPIDLALNELIDLKFESGEELQRYFDLSKRINSLLISEKLKTADKVERLEKQPAVEQNYENIGKEDFMGTDFKSEISILRIIKDMVELSTILNKRIDAYNIVNPKNPLSTVNSLYFPSLAEVNRVFKTEIKDSNAEDTLGAA